MGVLGGCMEQNVHRTASVIRRCLAFVFSFVDVRHKSVQIQGDSPRLLPRVLIPVNSKPRSGALAFLVGSSIPFGRRGYIRAGPPFCSGSI